MAIETAAFGELASQIRKAGDTLGSGSQPPAAAPGDVQIFEQALVGADVRPETQAISRAVKAEKALNFPVNGIEPGNIGPDAALAVVQRSNEIHFFSEFWAKLAAGVTQGLNKLVSMS